MLRIFQTSWKTQTNVTLKVRVDHYIFGLADAARVPYFDTQRFAGVQSLYTQHIFCRSYIDYATRAQPLCFISCFDVEDPLATLPYIYSTRYVFIKGISNCGDVNLEGTL